jgi:hypothetical protein
MTFTALNSSERAASNGQPLHSMVLDRVTLQRPDELRALRLMDGVPKEFYYDNKTMPVYLPSTNVVSVAGAPPTIDQMLDAAWNAAATSTRVSLKQAPRAMSARVSAETNAEIV